jgi:probable RNA-binding protein EIF1AD
VKGEITKILYKDQISYIKQEGKWPHQFLNKSSVEQATEKIDNLNISTDECDKSSDEDTDDDLFKNTNRPSYQYESETSSSNDESNDDEEIEKEKD